MSTGQADAPADAEGNRATTMKRLPLVNRPPDQLAYTVADLETGVRELGRAIGVRDWEVWDYGPAYVPRRFYRGRPSDWRSLVAMPAFGPAVEIVQPVDGPSIYTDFLDQRGPGLHHVGYFVPDMSVVRATFTALGKDEVFSGGGHGIDGDGEFVFWDLTDTLGSYIEAIAPLNKRRAPHFTLTVDLDGV